MRGAHGHSEEALHRCGECHLPPVGREGQRGARPGHRTRAMRFAHRAVEEAVYVKREGDLFAQHQSGRSTPRADHRACGLLGEARKRASGVHRRRQGEVHAIREGRLGDPGALRGTRPVPGAPIGPAHEVCRAGQQGLPREGGSSEQPEVPRDCAGEARLSRPPATWPGNGVRHHDRRLRARLAVGRRRTTAVAIIAAGSVMNAAWTRKEVTAPTAGFVTLLTCNFAPWSPMPPPAQETCA